MQAKMGDGETRMAESVQILRETVTTDTSLLHTSTGLISCARTHNESRRNSWLSETRRDAAPLDRWEPQGRKPTTPKPT